MSNISAGARKELVATVAERYQAGSARPGSGASSTSSSLSPQACHQHSQWQRTQAGGTAWAPLHVRPSRGRGAGGPVGSSGRVGGRRLKALLPVLVPALEHHGQLHLDPQVRAQLVVSAATIDRRLVGGSALGDGWPAPSPILPEGLAQQRAGAHVHRLARPGAGLRRGRPSGELRRGYGRQLCVDPSRDRYRQRMDGLRGPAGA